MEDQSQEGGEVGTRKFEVEERVGGGGVGGGGRGGLR